MCAMKASNGDEVGKLFVGGISWESSQESLLNYFSQFGEVVDCVVMKNPQTGKSRGFGFVTFKDPSCVTTVLAHSPHILDNRQIDPKACNPKSMNKVKTPSFDSKAKKIFIGGIPANCDENALRNFFNDFGEVTEVVIMYDQEKKRSRGFGFMSFATEDEVERVCQQQYYQINGKQVEIKKAQPRHQREGGQFSSGRGGQMQDSQPSFQGMPGNFQAGFPPSMFTGQTQGGPPQWAPPPQGVTPPGPYGAPPGGQGGAYNGWGGPPQAKAAGDYNPYSQPQQAAMSAYGTPPMAPQQSYGAMGSYSQESSSYGQSRVNGQGAPPQSQPNPLSQQYAGVMGYGMPGQPGTESSPAANGYGSYPGVAPPAPTQSYPGGQGDQNGRGASSHAASVQSFHPYRR